MFWGTKVQKIAVVDYGQVGQVGGGSEPSKVHEVTFHISPREINSAAQEMHRRLYENTNEFLGVERQVGG